MPIISERVEKLLTFDRQFELPIIGVDEVGRGALAGSVFAAAVHFVELSSVINIQNINKLDDSKRVNSKYRALLNVELREVCQFAIGESSSREIDKMGIVSATMLAFVRAIRALQESQTLPEAMVLVDGNASIPSLGYKQQAIVRGDSASLHIAAASIIAKVARDRRMISLAERYQGFGWETNFGYGTVKHIASIKSYGPTDQHRTSFLQKLTTCKP